MFRNSQTAIGDLTLHKNLWKPALRPGREYNSRALTPRRTRGAQGHCSIIKFWALHMRPHLVLAGQPAAAVSSTMRTRERGSVEVSTWRVCSALSQMVSSAYIYRRAVNRYQQGPFHYHHISTTLSSNSEIAVLPSRRKSLEVCQS